MKCWQVAQERETRFQSCLDKGDFSRASTRCVDGERKTKSVCQSHELRAFAPLGGTHGCPPFFATMNVPSIRSIHSERSIWPRSRRSSASTVKDVTQYLRCPPTLVAAVAGLVGREALGQVLPASATERKIQSTPLSTSL